MQKEETISHCIALCAYYRAHGINISRYLIVSNFVCLPKIYENSAQLILTSKKISPLLPKPSPFLSEGTSF